jgi:HEAT repeat protein
MTRVAALEGLARLDGPKALPTILEAVKAPDAPIQAEAVRLAARHGGQTQLLQAFPALAPPIQVKVLTALSEAGAASALPAFRTATLSPDEAVRTAAIRALGVNGGPAEVDLLARKASETEGVERDEARSALARLKGAATDAAIVKAIPAAEPKLKVELIRAACERGAQDAAPAILVAARSTDRDVRREAYRALREIAPAQSIPELVALLAAAPAAADRREMERALASALRRNPKAPLAPVEKEYAAAQSTEAKASLLSVMGQSAREDALPHLRAALSLPEPALRRAAILTLTEWPSPAPSPDLLSSARSDSEAALKVLALRGYIKLVSAPSELAPAHVARQLAEVLKVNPQPDEKKALLAALTRFICLESLDIAKSLTADPAVAAEAKSAADRIGRGIPFRR